MTTSLPFPKAVELRDRLKEFGKPSLSARLFCLSLANDNDHRSQVSKNIPTSSPLVPSRSSEEAQNLGLASQINKPASEPTESTTASELTGLGQPISELVEHGGGLRCPYPHFCLCLDSSSLLAKPQELSPEATVSSVHYPTYLSP